MAAQKLIIKSLIDLGRQSFLFHLFAGDRLVDAMELQDDREWVLSVLKAQYPEFKITAACLRKAILTYASCAQIYSPGSSRGETILLSEHAHGAEVLDTLAKLKTGEIP